MGVNSTLLLMPLYIQSVLVPSSSTIPFIMEDIHMKGGFRVVSTIEERDAIPTGARKQGMRVLVVNDSFNEYTLSGGTSNTSWQITQHLAKVHNHQISDVADLQTELDGKAPAMHSHTVADVTGLQTLLDSKAPTAHSHTFDDVAGLQVSLDSKAPTVHGHTLSEVSGLQTELDGKASATHTHSITDVTGLQGVLDNKAAANHTHVLDISDVTGLQGVLDDKAAANHTHVIDISDVTGLQTTLDAKASVTHGHTVADVTGLQTELDGKAPTVHGHTISAIAGLQTALDGKAPTLHGHAVADVTGLQTALDGRASIVHQHTLSEVSGLQTELDGKLDKEGGTVAGNLTVTGDLVIQGTSTVINTQELEVSDPIITVASGNATATIPYAGVKVERGATDAFMVFNEATDRWTAYVSADDLATAGTLADFQAGTFYGNLIGTATTSSSAAKLTTARTVTISGDGNATGSFDGSADLSLTLSVNDDSHNHTISTVTGLQTALDAKAPTTHNHTISTVTGLQTALDAKAPTTHNHTISTVTGLQTALDAKAPTTHSHAVADVTGLQTALDSKSATTHSHPNATTSVSGLMSNTDKIKLDGVAVSANNYVHPAGDGNLHVPATGTGNNLKVLKAGSTAGSAAWGTVAYSELSGVPSTFAPSAHTHVISNITNLQSTLDGKLATTGTAANSSLLQGFASSTAATANTVALRDSAGKITAVDFTMTSDARLKNILSTLDDEAALQQVLRWESVFYQMKGETRIMPGFIAQQIQQISPELVTDNEEFLSVSYALTSAYYAGAIRAIMKRIA